MRSSRPSVFPRTPRQRDASRRPSIDRSEPTTADARDEPSIAAASPSIPRRPPAAHDTLCNRTAHGARRLRRPSTSAHRTDRGAHCRGPAFSVTATRTPIPTARSPSTATRSRPPCERPWASARRRAEPRRATPAAGRGVVSPIAAAGLAAHDAARSRRAQIRRASEGAPGPNGGIERFLRHRTPPL